MGLLFVIATILICIYCRREGTKKKPSSLITNVTDDNSTKQKIIQTSSSEQSSSAGSLYGSDKSENITVETSVSLFNIEFKKYKLNIFLRICFYFLQNVAGMIPHSSDNLTNKLFHSIQTDLSLLTEANQQITSTRGTYV